MTLDEALLTVKKLDKDFIEKYNPSLKELLEHKEFWKAFKALMSRPEILLELATNPLLGATTIFVVAVEYGFIIATLMEKGSLETNNNPR